MTVVDWGPVSSWLAAVGTILAATIALFGGFRVFDLLRTPRLRLTFEQTEPWCRITQLVNGPGLWVRVRVENVGRDPTRGCVGQVTRVTTGEAVRDDIEGACRSASSVSAE